MHLVLPFDPPWRIKEAPDDRFVAIGADLVVTYGPLELATGSSLLHVDVPAGARVEAVRTDACTTRDGWPMQLVDAEVLTSSGLVEARLYACFTFLAYTAVAVVRAANSTPIEAQRVALVRVFERGRPDWRGPPICLLDAWDVGSAADDPLDRAKLERIVAETPTTAEGHVERGRVLLGLGQPDDAIATFRTAIRIDDRLATAHHYLGIALGQLADHHAAATAWRRALELAPDMTDAHYNLAQACALLGDHAAALAEFQTVVRLVPEDVLVRRKLIQCLYALGHEDEGGAARAAFRAAWATSRDPRVTHLSEYVFDQFAADGVHVHAIETLRLRDAASYPVIVFRAVRGPSHDEPLPAAVFVETSEPARRAGTPFVIAVVAGTAYRVVGAHAVMPSYKRLVAEILPLLVTAVREISG